MSDVTNGIFSDHCYDEMWHLYKTPEDEVGTEVDKRLWAGRSPTNCIIYVSNVLMYAHEKIGRADRNRYIYQYGKEDQDGSKLANYLIREIGWKAHYWNPDVRNPRDGKSEHPVSYKQILVKKYYLPNTSNLPISGLIIDYNKTNKQLVNKTIWTSTPIPPLGSLPIPHSVTVHDENIAILEKLSKVKFAFGITRGGTHTFLFSYGEVFEVHWDQVGTKLYGRKLFKNYEWLSGALIIPPDSSFTSDEIKAR